PAYTAELTDLSSYPPVAMLREGKAGLVAFTDESGRDWHAYTTVLENGWGVIVQQQDSEYLQTSIAFGNVASLVFIVGLLILLSVIWVIIRQAIHPIVTLTQTAAMIAN